MSISSIRNTKIKIKPTKELLNFIKNNEDVIRDFLNVGDIFDDYKEVDLTADNKWQARHLSLSEFDSLKKAMAKLRCMEKTNVYIHEYLAKCTVMLPENELIPRNEKLEERCEKLRVKQANVAYMNITKNVDLNIKQRYEDSFAFQFKEVNRQVIAVFQFVCSVIAGFVFGFLGIELIVGNLDFGFRLLLGIMCALVIALAEIYFLAKKLNECDDMCATKIKND